MTPAEVARLKQRMGVSDDMIATLGQAQGMSPQQIAAVRAGQAVPLQPGQRAKVEPMLQGGSPAPNAREGQFNLARGLDRHEVADGAWGGDAPAPTTTTLQAPTAAELTANATVIAAIDASWADSNVTSPTGRHEEGGWIYMDTTTGAITTRRAPRGQGASINIWNPPTVTGSVVVGNWHTHPNPTSEGWVPGPSPADLTNQGQRNIPGIVKADDGLHTFGANRRASLTGNPGFP